MHLARAGACIDAQSLARDLVNEPAAEIYPGSLARIAESLAGDRLTVSVWDEATIREKGMGGITGVGQGSTRPPRFVHMSWASPGPQKGHVALVGKGVTFDSGGLSLKPNDGMLTMRCDMAGAAVVVATMKAIKAIQPNVRVDGIFGAVENMPSGTSYKLGDILKMYNGKRVEIHNTDAEGRLVLADCLAYASELKPDAIVDLATLTGAAVVALGDWYSALYSRSDDLAAALLSAASSAGEAAWRMPLPELYKEKIKAEWGDLKNTGGRAGGSITAALFLGEFVTTDRWAHVDIAGPAFLDSALMHYCAGGTGTMVRTLTRWIEGIS
jgi:leucyl aminopeptidase